ncbi:MAG: hypothetical protein PF590_10165 [Candidatus Delongbacteria bacterium]|jgi:hypothetical protein|nr:hypothetical protein [Candidatus Delongbacteria bacterium]
MKPEKTRKITQRFSPWAWMILIVVSIVYICINYAGTEGLNPSDDGLVLAQSWRIILGQVPHLEFISIRPVGSGVLHSIHFLLPFPLEINARYFVLFQFFVIAFSWVQFFRLKSNFKHEIPNIYKLSLLIIAWVCTIYNHYLFPWSTIDAIFWSSIGFYLTERSFNIRRQTICLALGLLAFVLAALSRQTFAVITIIGWLWVAIRLYRKKAWKAGLIAAAIGILPILSYAIVIAMNDAGRAFLTQMTGCTEFYDTAVIPFYNHFTTNNMKWINIAIISMAVLVGIGKRLSTRLYSFIATLPAMRMLFLLETALVLYMLYGIPEYFINAESRDIYTLSFRAFWILLDILLISILVQGNKFNACIPALFGMLVAWTGTISRGANTPILSLGILVISILYVYLIKYQDALLLKQKWIRVVLPAIALLYLITGTISQQNINYRDVSIDEQTHNLKNIHPDYGKIKTNKHTYAYFEEIDSLISNYKNSDTHIVFLPDNAIIYPVYRLKNPLSVDWPQDGELIGQKKRFNKELIWKIDEGVIFCLQKYNVKKIHKGYKKLDYSDYPYMETIFTECQLLDETRHFRIYSKYPME